MSRGYFTYTTEVDVDVRLDELLDDLSDEELAEHGLIRVSQQTSGHAASSARSDAAEHALCSEGLDAHVLACRTLRVVA